MTAITARDAALLARRPYEARAASHSAITRAKARALRMTALRSHFSDAVAKLVLFPVVGVGLCGAVTLLFTLQCVETLQRRRQLLQWRVHVWTALLAFLVAFLPSKRLKMAGNEDQKSQEGLDKATSTLLCNGKREGQETSAGESVESRPLKRQRSETGKGEEEAEKEETREKKVEESDAKKKKPGRKTPVKRRVFIWDLDETLVLFASLYTGTFAQTHGKEVAPGVALGEQMMTFLLAMLERHFFFNDLHDADVDHIARVAARSESENVEVNLPLQENRERYERIREIYERRGHVDFLHDTDSQWFAIRSALVAGIDSFSTGWLHEARQVLELITGPVQNIRSSTMLSGNNKLETPVGLEPVSGYSSGNDDEDVAEEVVENVNVLVTNTQLVPALCKCLIYQLDSFFPIDRVYSSAKIHKYRCFETIVAKYNAPGVEFVAIGDGLEEEQVSIALGLEFHKIRSLVDLKRLRYDLQLVQNNSSGSGSPPAEVGSPSMATMRVPSSVGQTTVV
ncbi:Eyes absent 3 [Phytophthora boehmeriae]|uniref:Eyes absent 3 n=1 Tax=Phytophthora boehmeriae TaxID=109152 RepID=A0A8T1WQ88_9STRA|nr:Eyes absent 3 [Phytophthora boehmeriae]